MNRELRETSAMLANVKLQAKADGRPAGRTQVTRNRALAFLLAIAALALPAHAAAPVLHEFISPDAVEDVALDTTTLDGTMPAAIQTNDGDIVEAPSPKRRPAPLEKAYSGSTPTTLDSSYQIDSDTRRPEVVSYDDPFTPAVTPFKRLFAYDSISDTLELVVGDKSLRPLDIGGEVRPGDDQFYGDMFVDVEKNVPVRIPSVGPDSKIVAAHVDPPGPFELLRDGADNWFIRMDERARVRLVMQLAIPRATFGSRFNNAPWHSLGRYKSPLPASAKLTAQNVMAHVGVSQAMSPRDALRQLVAYFRAFRPSNERPTSTGAKLYEDLAFSQKGVCRHRAYAFVITANEVGLPARLIRNEAHAWVEVYDTNIWHRIDLGGAASRMEAPLEDNTEPHRPPEDPFAWPEGSETGLDMAASSGPTSGGQPGATGGGPTSSTTSAVDPTSPNAVDDPLAPPDAETEEDPDAPVRPPAELTLEVARDTRLYRGAPLVLTGVVESDGEPCSHARVDVSLVSGKGPPRKIGALAADAEGRYRGAVVIPLDTGVGDYDVLVSTPGDARCGAGLKR